MKPFPTGLIIFIVFVWILSVISGCTSLQKNSTVVQPVATLLHSTNYSISIDPIRDFNTDSSGNITGSTILNVSGTTNYPPGTYLVSEILAYNGERIVWRTSLDIRRNETGPNTFFYDFDMKGNSPGRYQVSVSTSFYDTTQAVISRFDILPGNTLPDASSYKWIDLDPLSSPQKGKTFSISGSTNLPAGTEITVGYSIIAHSCTPSPTPDKPGKRTFCGGGCKFGEGSSYIVHVVKGTERINSWNYSVNTTGLCTEVYEIGAEAGNGTDSRHAGQSIWIIPE